MEFLKRQGIKQATIVIAAATVLSQLLGLIRESIIARFLGTSAEYDILLVAMAIPMMMAGILFQAIPSAGIPFLNRGKGAAIDELPGSVPKKSFLSLTSLVILILSIMAYMVIPLFRPLLAKGLTPEAASRVIFYGRIFCLLIPLRSYESIFRSLLHIKHNFLFPSMAMFGFNAAVIVILLTLFPRFGSPAFIFAWLMGMLLQMLMVVVPVRLLNRGDKSPAGAFDSSGYINFLGIIILVEAISILIDPFDRYLCGLLLDAGHVSAVNYANIIYLVPVRVMMYSMATALFPSLAEKAATKDLYGLAKQYHKAIGLAIMVMVPTSVFFILNREEIVKLLFERGQFNEVSRQMTSDVLYYYLAGMFFTSAFFIQSRVVYALKSWKILLISRSLAMIVKVAIGVWLIRASWALAVAGGTIVLYAFAFISVEIFLIVVAGIKYSRKDINFIIRSLLAAVLTAMVVMAAWFVGQHVLVLGDIHQMALSGICGAGGLIAADQMFQISGINLSGKRS